MLSILKFLFFLYIIVNILSSFKPHMLSKFEILSILTDTFVFFF
jgi:hypothetical protein